MPDATTPINFSDVLRAAESGFEIGGISGYLQKVEDATKGDLDGYLAWAQKQPSPSAPALASLDLMQALKTVDLSDVGSLYKNGTTLCRFAPFQLAAEPNAKLVVVPDASALLPPTSEPEKPANNGNIKPPPAAHPFFLSLSAEGKAAVPRFVLPLGRLVREYTAGPVTKDTSPDPNPDPSWGGKVSNKPLRDETNYSVVIDVVEAGHPIWLIYNRNPIDPDAGVRVGPIDPNAQPAVFSGVPNVDSVRLLNSLSELTVAAGGKPIDVKKLTEGFGQVGRDTVKASIAVEADVDAALGRTW